jgi:hypothetical protein
VCKANFLFFRPMGLLDLVVWIFFLLILSEVSIQYVGSASWCPNKLQFNVVWILREWRNHNDVQKELVAYLLAHPIRVELLKSMVKWTRYGHAKLGRFSVKNEKSHEAFPLVLGVGAPIHEVFFLGSWSNLVVKLILFFYLVLVSSYSWKVSFWFDPCWFNHLRFPICGAHVQETFFLNSILIILIIFLFLVLVGFCS